MNKPKKALPFRINDWWSSKASLLMGFSYMVIILWHFPFYTYLTIGVLSLIVISGFATMGYLINDFFDQESDLKAGKRNFLIGKSNWHILLLFLFSLLLIFLPWLYLPATFFSFLLVCFQLGMFVVYSAPPIRLKEKGWKGIIIDALYAHAIPTILATYTFSLSGNNSLSAGIFISLFVWQFLSGVRNIILHLREDQLADQQIGIQNFAAQLNSNTLHKLLRNIIGVELLCSLLFFWQLTSLNSAFAYCITFILAYSMILAFWALNKGAETFFKSNWQFFPNAIYEQWLPAIYLTILGLEDVRFFYLLGVHTVLLNFRLVELCYEWLYILYHTIPFNSIFYTFYLPLRKFTSWLINYFLYFSFLLIGINLKKEKKTASDYLRRKKNPD